MKLPDLIPENIYPVGPRILLEVYKQADKTSGGLEMSEGDGHATPSIGRVVRTGGPGGPYEVGDFLMWRRYGVDSIKVSTAEGDVEFYLLEEQEVIAKINGEVDTPQKRSNYNQIIEKQNATRTKEQEQGEIPSSSEEKPSEEK